MFRRKQIERRNANRYDRYDGKLFRLFRMYTTDDEPDEVRTLVGREVRDIDKVLRGIGYVPSGCPTDRWCHDGRETVYWVEPVNVEVPHVR